jgi:hypothetical protein
VRENRVDTALLLSLDLTLLFLFLLSLGGMANSRRSTSTSTVSEYHARDIIFSPVRTERVFIIPNALHVFPFTRRCRSSDISPCATTVVHVILVLLAPLLHVSIHRRTQALCATGGKRER